MDPRDYLAFSRDLLRRLQASQGLVSPGGPAECRSAISRAYYSAYLVAVEFLGLLGLAITSSGKSHTVVQYGLNNSGNPTLARVSTHLSSLYSQRRQADYEMARTSPESVPNAQAQVELADQTIALLDQCRRDCTADAAAAPALANTILSWARTAGEDRNLWSKPSSSGRRR